MENHVQPTFDWVCFRPITVEDFEETERLKQRVLAQLVSLSNMIDDELDEEDTRFVNSEVPR